MIKGGKLVLVEQSHQLLQFITCWQWMCPDGSCEAIDKKEEQLLFEKESRVLCVMHGANRLSTGALG